MRTSFSPAQLADPATAASEAVIRTCVHCGFCTATCPTYVLLGDELDSPRGRIILMKDMLEADRAPTPEVVKHIDRCLSCLSCMTTCPSGVNYMHLVDHARAYVERRYRRSPADRLVRAMLAFVLPHRARFRVALALARLARPLAPLFARTKGLAPLAAMLKLAPKSPESRFSRASSSPPYAQHGEVSAKPTEGPRESAETGAPASSALPRGPLPPPEHVRGRTPPFERMREMCVVPGRVAVLVGCAEPVLQPQVRDAAVRVLARAGFQVVAAPGEACCGALVHHMGRDADSLAAARRNVDAWTRLIEAEGLDAILVTASGCGTTIKDYGFILRGDPAYADKARRVSALARDISEFLAERAPSAEPPALGRGVDGLVVAYHAACSLQHGQKVVGAPQRLLAAAGYTVRTPSEAHMCCGSAGTYNILQPEIAGRLGARKVAALEALAPQVIATGNVGCAMQIGARTGVPVVHTVELLDWAAGGPKPAALVA